MAVFTVATPDFRFSGMYYPQIRQSLIVYKRANMPLLSDEDPNEPSMQHLDLFSVGFHYCNVLLDHVALETLMPTARLRESVRAHLLLINRRLREAVPATAELLAKLSAPLTATVTLPDRSRFGAERTTERGSIDYENIGALEIARTDRFGAVLESDGGVFTDRTTEIVTPSSFTPWGGVPAAGDALYFGLESAIFDRLVLKMSALGDIWDESGHVWEYYDDSVDDTVPNDVDEDTGELVFDLTTLLGTNNRAGLTVTVRYAPTGETEEAVSVFESSVNVVRTGLFGQSSPSTDASDYVVGANWKEPPGVVETFSSTTLTLGFSLPDLASQSRSWTKSTVNGVEAYWLRLRIVAAAVGSPVVNLGADMNNASQYVKFSVTQGRTQIDDPLGTFDGTRGQRFVSTLSGVIDGSSRIYVDEGSGYVEYIGVDDYLSSVSSDREMVRSYDSRARIVLRAGDGINGRLPAVGSPLKLVYRVDAADDGSVGANQIRLNKSSIAYLGVITNPRPATGWKAPEGSTPASLATLKISGPASLRLKERAITSGDHEELAIAWTDKDGGQPVTRAKATVDGYGEKTFKLVVVGAGGNYLSAGSLTRLRAAASGDQVESIDGWAMTGIEVIPVNYTRRVIPLTVTVRGGVKSTIEAALAAALSPVALTDAEDPYSWVHDFRSTIYGKKLESVIFETKTGVRDVVTDISDVTLVDDELPYPGAINVTVIE